MANTVPREGMPYGTDGNVLRFCKTVLIVSSLKKKSLKKYA